MLRRPWRRSTQRTHKTAREEQEKRVRWVQNSGPRVQSRLPAGARAAWSPACSDGGAGLGSLARQAGQASAPRWGKVQPRLQSGPCGGAGAVGPSVGGRGTAGGLQQGSDGQGGRARAAPAGQRAGLGVYRPHTPTGRPPPFRPGRAATPRAHPRRAALFRICPYPPHCCDAPRAATWSRCRGKTINFVTFTIRTHLAPSAP